MSRRAVRGRGGRLGRARRGGVGVGFHGGADDRRPAGSARRSRRVRLGCAAMDEFRGRTVVVGVSGGIAAYKACELVRLLVKGGARVRVAMTPNATRFVGPLTFQAL